MNSSFKVLKRCRTSSCPVSSLYGGERLSETGLPPALSADVSCALRLRPGHGYPDPSGCPMPGTLKQNLHAARQACAEVKRLMKYGARNRKWDVRASAGMSIGCVDDLRDHPEFPWSYRELENLRKMASLAGAAGCGNCPSQAAIAFVHLADKLKVRPLDYMTFFGLDHVFVVIGRAHAGRNDVGEWGPTAVVCDPWDGQVYPAVEVRTRMAAFTGVNGRSLYSTPPGAKLLVPLDAARYRPYSYLRFW